MGNFWVSYKGGPIWEPCTKDSRLCKRGGGCDPLDILKNILRVVKLDTHRLFYIHP